MLHPVGRLLAQRLGLPPAAGWRDLLEGRRPPAGRAALTEAQRARAARKLAARQARAAAADRARVARLVRAGDLAAARALLAPHVRARDVAALVARLDVRSPRGRAVFWSGARDAAQAHARAIGGVTLETTPGGRVVDGWDLVNRECLPWERGGKELWGALAQRFAAGARGRVHVVQSRAAAARGGGDLWRNCAVDVLNDLQGAGVVTEVLPTRVVPNPVAR